MPEPGNIIHQDQSLYWNAYAHARRNALSTGANLITQMVVVIIIIIFDLTSNLSKIEHYIFYDIRYPILYPLHI